jgi:hypothetical protein
MWLAVIHPGEHGERRYPSEHVAIVDEKAYHSVG